MSKSIGTQQKVVGLILIIILVIATCASVYYTSKIAKEKKVLLHSFAVTNIGLFQQKYSTEQKNEAIVMEFINQAIVNPRNERIRSIKDQAIEVAKLSKQMNDWIEVLKIELIAFVDGCNLTIARERVLNPFKVVRKGNCSKTDIFFGTDDAPGTNGKAHDLKLQMDAYRESLLPFLTNEYGKRVITKNIALLNLESTMDSKSENTWEMFYFYHQPLSGALVELTRYQNMVRDAENELLTYLWEQISATTFKFDAVVAVIMPKITNVKSGSNFEADVFFAAYSQYVKPIIIYGTSVDTITGEVKGGMELPRENFSNGMGHISIPTSGTGTRTCAGVMKIINPITAEITPYMFSTNYNVTAK